MRQWLVDPKIMCRKHLLGEHVEHHMIIGSITKKKNINGFLKNNLLEPKSLQRRHQELADEMESRGYTHKSPLVDDCVQRLTATQRNWVIDKDDALKELLRRCPKCRERYDSLYKYGKIS